MVLVCGNCIHVLEMKDFITYFDDMNEYGRTLFMNTVGLYL